MIATYLSDTSFGATGDKIATFLPGVKCRANCGVDGYKYTTVVSRTYNGVTTSVVVSGDALTANITDVTHGFSEPAALCAHEHTGATNGGTIAHTALTAVGTNTHAAIDTFIGTKAAASGLASLNASSLVVQNPANATATATASKIPIADASGKLDTWISAASTTVAGKIAISSVAPVALGTAAAGAGTTAAAYDHVHPTTGLMLTSHAANSITGFDTPATTVSTSTSAAAGAATTIARSDHNHNLGTHAHTDATDGGLLDYLGLSVRSEVSVTAAATLTSTAFGKMHFCSGTTADYTVVLPTASGNAGKLLGIRIGTGCTKLITLDGNAAEAIDNLATRVMWAGESAILLCEGTGWKKIAGKSIPMACRMQGPNTQSIAGSIYTVLTLSTNIVNVGSMGDTANNRVLIRRPGTYRVSSQISLQSPPSTVNVGFQMLHNGGHLALGGGTGLYSGTTPTTDIIASANAGAAFTVRCFHTHTASLTTGTETFLNVEEIISW